MMSLNHVVTRSKQVNRSSGFTLIEILVVVSVIAILGAIALPAYQSYIAKARSSELALKYDGVRTNVQVQAKAGTIIEQCSAVPVAVNAANLHSEYAAMDVAFEAVPGGFTPVMRFCASSGTQGVTGVDVTREAHHLLSRSATIGKGAVIGDAVVSFSVGLLEGAVVCKVAPPASSGVAGCNLGAAKATASTTPNVPASAASNPSSAASAAIAVSTAPVQKPPAVCAANTPQQVERKVMQFGSGLTGYIMNTGDLNSGGDMRSFTAEVSIVGGQQAPIEQGHGPTMLSYASHSQTNEFLLQNPANIRIYVKNVAFTTGVNVNDGQNHRLTTTWQSSDGALVLFDNGREVWRGVTGVGGVMGGNGKLVLGQDQDTYGGGFGLNDAFQGKIITASLASTAVSGAQIATGPIHTSLDPASGLITNVVLDANGKPVDSTRRATFTAGGSLTAATQPVDTSLYVTKDCQ